MPRLVASPLLILALSGCGDPPEPSKSSEDSGPQSPTPNAGDDSGSSKSVPAPNSPSTTAKIELNEDTLESWIATMVDLREAGVKANQSVSKDPNALKGYLSSLTASNEWKEALSAHGYSLESFRDVSDQVSRAWAAVMIEDQLGSLQPAMNKQLEAMKNLPGMSEAQLEQVRAQMAESQQKVDDLANGATDETKALIKKYRAKLESTFQ